MYRRQFFKTIVTEATLHKRDLVRFLNRDEIYAIFQEGLSCEEQEEDSVPVTMNRLLDQGIENVRCCDSDVMNVLLQEKDNVIRALMNHQSCEIEKKVDLEEEELVFGVKNLSLAFEGIMDDSKKDNVDDCDEDEEEKPEGEYDMTWLNRRDNEKEPTKGEKVRDEEEEFDLDDFEDCLVPGEKTSSMGISLQTPPKQSRRCQNTTTNILPTTTPAAFKRKRNVLVKTYYDEFNKNVFESKLPSCCATTTMTINSNDVVPITWNKRMLTSAGIYSHSLSLSFFLSLFYTHTHSHNTGFTYPKLLRPSMKRVARIELATKVVDEDSRLRETLLHELCHVAAWLLNGCGLQGSLACCTPHGTHFKYWASIATSKYPNMSGFHTCHSYTIHKKWRWRCTNISCGNVIMRHSKSLDVNRVRCGRCHFKFEFLGAIDRNGTPMRKRKPNQYAIFVKENFKQVRSRLVGVSHGEVMKEISRMWKERSRS